MPYSPDSQAEDLSRIDAEEQKTMKELSICRAVKEMVDSDGWKNTVGLLLDRMITDVVGGKIGDTWTGGKVDRARSEDKMTYYVGYKQSLIELHGRIMFHLTQIPLLEAKMKALEAERKPRYRVPMMEDTRYNPETPNG
jgi:hypothetical protein